MGFTVEPSREVIYEPEVVPLPAEPDPATGPGPEREAEPVPAT